MLNSTRRFFGAPLDLAKNLHTQARTVNEIHLPSGIAGVPWFVKASANSLQPFLWNAQRRQANLDLPGSALQPQNRRATHNA